MTNLTIIIPTKNEEESLKILLNEIKEYDNVIGEIIIVDANSTDNTLVVAKNENCRTILQNENGGYGDAIVRGVYASNYKYSIILDGDGSKNPVYINKLLETIISKDLDFVFAERYGGNANSLDDTFLTHIGNRIFTIMGKIFFKIKMNDILHTFFICKNTSFKKIDLNIIDFGFCVELPIKVERQKFLYSSIPTVERKRIAGEVKVRSFIDGYKILISMIKLFTKF
ncbi:glycosyltransferase family 2 protein [Pelagibacteraceae bacterium]|nr:glycosyltransferase family 2 protein [Candidatus Pelagibacter bacterium]MDC1253743.1 glycosyltransferase family 2 protein [Pelagibacteraceae bacterium]|tara:strand:+ start:405 stop:1085 length:681 start_codon:yes stop_codon:yes gene_type:complete